MTIWRSSGTSRSGFTLVEVMVAIVIGAITVSLAFQLFRGIDDAARALGTRDVTHTRQANARRWLSLAFAAVDVTPPSGAPFESAGNGIRFVGWVQVTDGWAEARRVDITVAQREVVGRIDGLPPVRLWSGVDTMLVDYLGQTGARAPWLNSWPSSVVAPVAVRFRVVTNRNVDTVLVAVGAGG